MIRTCWELGKRPEFADLKLWKWAHMKLWKWAHMLGFRSLFSSKSRCYSVALGQLRDDRRAWRTEQARTHAGLPEHDPRHRPLGLPRLGLQPRRETPRRHRLASQRTGMAVHRRGRLLMSTLLTVPSTGEDLLTVPQVMARLQLGRSAVYDRLRTRQLPSITLGRARRIPTHALTDFIRTRLEQNAA